MEHAADDHDRGLAFDLQSARTFSRTSLRQDMVFGDDGGASQLGTTTGSVDEGYAVELRVAL